MVRVRFTVEPSGKVLDVSVVQSSGSARLDAAALALLRNAAVPPSTHPWHASRSPQRWQSATASRTKITSDWGPLAQPTEQQAA